MLSTIEPRGDFTRHFALGSSTKLCCHIPVFVKIGQKWRTPYQKTCLRFCSHQLAMCSRKRTMILSKL